MNRAQRVVIYGPEGIGKSTLAANNMPAPLFLDTEDGTCQLDVDRVPVRSVDDLREAMAALLAEAKAGTCEYKSVVLDTADRLWMMCADYVCAENNWKDIEQPGYGKGYAVVAGKFRSLFGGFDKLMRAGLHVCIVCHAKVDRIVPPDNTEYNKYLIKISAPNKQAEQSREYVKEWCDTLLFCHYQIAVDQEKRRLVGGGNEAVRVVSTVPTPAWEAKNRFGLPAELPMEAGVLAALFAEPEELRITNYELRIENSAASPQGEVTTSGATRKEEEKAQVAAIKPSSSEKTEGNSGEEALLVEFFVATGKLKPGEGLDKLPESVKQALATRREAAVAKAKAWKAERRAA